MNALALTLGLLLTALPSYSQSRSGDFLFQSDRAYWAFNFAVPSFSGASGDSQYTGSFASGWGFGGFFTYLLPLENGMEIGPNFNFLYNSLGAGSLYSYETFHPSFGPTLKLQVGKMPLFLSANYNMGWAFVYQELPSCSDIVCPAGDFNVGLRGWTFDIRGALPIGKGRVAFAPYFSLGSLAFTNFQYKFKEIVLGQAKYRTIFADIGLNYTHLGLSLLF